MSDIMNVANRNYKIKCSHGLTQIHLCLKRAVSTEVRLNSVVLKLNGGILKTGLSGEKVIKKKAI